MLDILFAILMIIAIIKGYQKGFILALFSIIALVVGLAAALKLSAMVAVYLQANLTINGGWLPAVSFALVFFVVVFLVHLGGKLIQKTFELALMGWANRLGGIIIYTILYTIIFSVFLFYAERLSIFEPATLEASAMYPFLKTIGPNVIDNMGKLLPVFRDMFAQLESFFEGVAHKIDQ